MSLFRKEKIPDGIRVEFYEGPLQGFETNYPVQILSQGDKLRITRVKPDITVYLKKNRITSCEIMQEMDYMARYHGNAVNTSRINVPKWFCVIHYTSKSGTDELLSFWTPAGRELKKMRKMFEEIKSSIGTKQYEI